MPELSHVIPESHQNVSPKVLETLIQSQRVSSFTGLMRLNHFPGEDLIFSFLDGKQEKLYSCHDGAVEILPRQAWPDALDSRSEFVGFLPLSMDGMRFARIVHEAPVHRVEESTFTCERLIEVAGKWALEKEPVIIHVQGAHVNRYYLIAGASAPVIEEFSILDGEAHVSLSDASFPKMLPKLEYRVVRYVSTDDHDLWREHELRFAFHPFMRILLNRFGELAGRVLTERLCEQLTLWAREGGWNITVNSNGMMNRQYFDSLESAIGLYVGLLRRFQDEASPAIGAGMAREITYEVLSQLDSVRSELLNQVIFSRLGAGSAVGASGVR